MKPLDKIERRVAGNPSIVCPLKFWRGIKRNCRTKGIRNVVGTNKFHQEQIKMDLEYDEA